MVGRPEGRCNVLLEGPGASTEATLARLMPHLRGIVQWNPLTVPLDLPRRRVRNHVRDVSELQGSRRFLTGGLRRRADTPRSSTTVKPLFSSVKRGLFDERLYYRLNVLLLQME